MNILSWNVTKNVPAPCPDYVPDPYTGELPMFHCAVYHYQTITEKRVKEFNTRKEAVAFANNAPSSCTDFTLNGKLLKDTRKKQDNITITVSDGTTLTGGSGTTIISSTSVWHV